MTTKRTASTAFRDAVNRDYLSKQLGENGSPEFTDYGVGSSVLALSQLVRDGDPKELADSVLATGSCHDIADLTILLFVTRNTRGGKGEKKLAFDIFFRLMKHYPRTAVELLPLFSHYGYWKDLLLILEMALADPTVEPNAAPLVKAVIGIMHEQFRKDINSLEQYKTELNAIRKDPVAAEKLRRMGPSISLLGKWLPREGSHFDKKIGFVSRFTESDEASNAGEWKSKAKKTYRKKVAELTSFLDLPEVLLSAQRADEINFNKIASKATLSLTKAFLNEDKDGRPRTKDPKRIRLAEMFVDHLVSKKRVKGGQLMPHEIVKQAMASYSRRKNMSQAQEMVLDAQWKDLWKTVVAEVKKKAEEEGLEFNPTQMVPLADVSGSMMGVPMEVSIALSIGISEITHPSFQNMVMTFESQPRWHRLNPTDTIVEKVRSLSRAPWGGSTNFEAAIDLILRVCVENKLSRDDMPSLIVFSDMQFDCAAGTGAWAYGVPGYGQRSITVPTMHDNIKRNVARVAKHLGWGDSDPKPIVYWNLRNTGGHPVDKDEAGTVLLAGFSPSLLKLVMNGEALKEEEVEIVQADGTVRTEKVRVTPEEVLRKMLDDTMYDPVREVLVRSSEGALMDYGEPLASEEVKADDSDFEMV